MQRSKEGGGLLSLEATGILTRDEEPGVTTLVDARNGFNKMSLLRMIWTVHHRFPEGSRFTFNCYKRWS